MGRPGITTSLMISTYNNPGYLEACLDSVGRMTVLPTEVVIADDGSGPETRAVVDRFRNAAICHVKHVWHEDRGFRLAAIRNKAIAAAQGDYIIQIDGDVLLEPHFVEDYIATARRGSFFGGSRILLSQETTARTIETAPARIPSAVRYGNAKGWRIVWLRDIMAGRVSRNPVRLRGSNMAFWREDALRVNGYNERIVGWGYEDIDFALRLQAAGVTKRYMKFGGLQFHLWHKENNKSNTEINKEISDRLVCNNITWCDDGIEKKTETT